MQELGKSVFRGDARAYPMDASDRLAMSGKHTCLIRRPWRSSTFREQFPERLKKEHLKRRSRFRQKAYYSFQSLRINRCSVIAVRFPYLLLAQGNYCPYWFAVPLPSPAERTLWHMMSFDQPPYDFIAKGIMSSFWSFRRKSGGRWGTRKPVFPSPGHPMVWEDGRIEKDRRKSSKATAGEGMTSTRVLCPFFPGLQMTRPLGRGI